MNCEVESQKHLCYLNSQGKDDYTKSFTDNKWCNAGSATPSEYLCAVHLKEDTPNVEGRHGFVEMEDVGKPH